MPPEQKTPGVYVEEISLPPPAINGVSTTVTAFIGATRRGASNQPRKVSSFADFERQFGGLSGNLELGYALQQFFINGGKEAVVVKAAATAAKLIAAIQKLDSVDLINLLVLPGISLPAVLSAAAAYCEKRCAFLIMDSPATAKTPAQVADCLANGTLPQTSYAAVYFPWIKIADPLKDGQPRVSAPSGAIAGAITQQDLTRGVAKAPANIQLRGILGFETELNMQQVELLNPIGVNCLRHVADRGPLIWGARTLAGSQAPDWKYIPVRRLALYVEESIRRGTSWAVFEPNNEPLWARIRGAVENFLYSLWSTGALMGTNVTEAYFVKCDRTTMSQSDIDNGRLIMLIGIAPVRPTEFLVLRISQQTAH